MPKYDISNAADFARITGQSVFDIAALGGIDPRDWDIQEASFRGVKFHVFKLGISGVIDALSGNLVRTNWQGALGKVTDSGGRRKIKYQYPYKDGQTTDDLGRKAQTFEMECVIFGERYLDGLRELERVFNDPTPGLLVHPIRGSINCVIEEVGIVYEHASRKAAVLTLKFTEHNFNAKKFVVDSVKSTLTRSLNAFRLLDLAILTIANSLLVPQALRNELTNLIQSYKRATAVNLTTMNLTFNARGGSADIPALLPVDQGGTGTAGQTGLGLVSTDLFPIVRSPSDPFNAVPVGVFNDSTLVALAIPSITRNVIALRDQLQVILDTIYEAPTVPAGPGTAGAPGSPTTELFDTIQDLKSTVVFVQEVLEAGLKSSSARVTDYTVPILMSLREVAFANGIQPDRVQELDALNPQLLSINYIAKGEVVRVPIE